MRNDVRCIMNNSANLWGMMSGSRHTVELRICWPIVLLVLQLKLEYSMWTRSIPWLLMPWLIARASAAIVLIMYSQQVLGHSWDRISSTCNISLFRNYRKCKYISCFLKWFSTTIVDIFHRNSHPQYSNTNQYICTMISTNMSYWLDYNYNNYRSHIISGWLNLRGKHLPIRPIKAGPITSNFYILYL